MNKLVATLFGLFAAASVLAQGKPESPEPLPEVISTINGDLRGERLATLEFPWGMALLPDGRLLITEKPGRLRIFNNGRLSAPIKNVPAVSYQGDSDQGGLLDVVLDPDFASNNRIYLSFSEAAPKQSPQLAETGDTRVNRTVNLDQKLRGGAVARATLDGEQLRDVEVIWRQVPKTIGRGHFGHRLQFGRDGMLYITSGERMRFEPAQSLISNLGKVVRIHPDGSIPKDNPFAGKEDARGDIWSVGHRNMLANAIDPNTGKLWVWEMGPLGGDEMNLVQAGKNYGWPSVSNGDNYDHSFIPDHPSQPELEAPLRSWWPVISPSGATFYQGSLLPWRGDALVGGLTAQGLIRLTLKDGRIQNEERIHLQRRVRDVLETPDGTLLLLTDYKKGELLHLMPASTQGQSQGQ
jgi:glucose/arabinose dehydrogenase